MTLADILRRYFERRRQICDKKTRYLTLGNGISQPYLNHDQDDVNCLRLPDISYFFNDLDSNVKKESSHKGDLSINKKGVNRRKLVTILPNGTIKYETVVKDSDGNEKIQTVRQEGHQLFVTTKGKKPSGEESIDENVIDISHLTDVDDILKYIDENHSTNNESRFEDDRWKMPFSGSKIEQENLNKHLSELRKSVEENFEYFQSSDKPNSLFKDFRLPDFSIFDDSPFKEDKRKFFKNVEPEVGRSYNTNPKKNQMRKEMEKFMKKVTTPQSSSIFESFGKNAMVEIPEEKTPLDKFVELDEDTKNSLLALRQNSNEIIRKLDKLFSNTHQNSQVESFRQDKMYSDIAENEDVGAQLMMPDREDQTANFNDLDDMFRHSFVPYNQFRTLFPFDGMQSQQFSVDNGKVRIVSMKKDRNGHEEKTVTYKIGDQQYSVKIVTDQNGRRINRERKMNFPEEELSNFKKRWHESYHSDFKD